jgi:hypothetical protein
MPPRAAEPGPPSPSPETPGTSSGFRTSFKRWSRRVRARLALKHVLTGAAIGLLVGAGASAALWKTRQGPLRPSGAAGGVIGAAVGFAVARRRRWSDPDVALYLDARLDADEAIATAVELAAKDDDDPARAVVISHASEALSQATSKKVKTPVLKPWHAALPLAAAAIGYLSWIPLPPAPVSAKAPPGSDKVQLAEVAGLEKVIKLSQLDARDEAQKERLRKMAEEAKRIREKLREGAEKRDAQADIAKLRDQINAERLTLGDGEQRAGMEAALGKMAANPDFKDAEKALGDRDLVKFDDEMEKLANKLEKQDREQAKKTLEEAAEAAKKAGAPGVAKELEQQKKLMEERGKKGDKLKELAKELGDGLGDDGKRAAEDFGKSGSPKDEKRLAEKLDDALGKLTPEQRKKLAENMKKQMAQAPEEEGTGKGPSKKQLKDMADQLDTPEGQQQLEDELKKMAEDPPPGSDESERQKALDGAGEGADDAEGQVGGMPMPTPGGPGDGKDGKDGKDGAGKNGGKDGKSGKDDGQAQSGHTDGGGPGDHKGQTGVIEGGDLRAHADAKINKGKPMPGMVMGRSAGRAGDTANIAGEGALGNAAPGEIGGIERSDVPEEYREQVGRYFQPR